MSPVYSWIVPIRFLNIAQAAKKTKKEDDDEEDSKATKEKQKADALALAQAKDRGEHYCFLRSW